MRVGYQVTGKISLSASGGVEFRQFGGDARGGYVSPVYDLSATYQPFDGTTITLSGNGSIQNSAALAAPGLSDDKYHRYGATTLSHAYAFGTDRWLRTRRIFRRCQWRERDAR